MKKSIIAAGAASVVLAAMPVVGVFADNYAGSLTGSNTDTVQLTINQSCTFSGAVSTDATEGIINLGTYDAPTATTSTKNGGIMSITCNDEDGWTIKASATALNNPTSGDVQYTIPFGAQNAQGSKWTALLTIDANNTDLVTNNWSSYATAATVNGGTTVVTSNTDNTTNRVKPVVGMTVTPTYQAVIGASQQAGTYQGQITYNFATSES